MSHILLIFMIISCAVPEDVSGKWSGTAEAKLPDGTPISGTLFLVLKQHPDGRLSGATGCDEADARPIEKGKIDGVKVLFEITNPRNGVISKFALSLVGKDKLEGSVSLEVEGTRRSMNLKLVRK